MFLRNSGVAIAAALVTSAVAASGASAAGVTQVSCSNGVVSVVGAANTTNVVSVSDAGTSKYTIQDVGDGATLAYTVGGCLAGISNYTATKGTITVSGTITSVKVDTGDLSDLVNTTGLAGKASIFTGDAFDLVYAGNGADTINGGTGDDNIDAGGGNDVITGWLGSDTIKAGAGNDTIYEADGYADSIDGGSGTDSATADPADTIVNLESVSY